LLVITIVLIKIKKKYLIYKELDDHDNPLEPLDQNNEKIPGLQGT
jgi:hypothetical protein